MMPKGTPDPQRRLDVIADRILEATPEAEHASVLLRMWLTWWDNMGPDQMVIREPPLTATRRVLGEIDA